MRVQLRLVRSLHRMSTRCQLGDLGPECHERSIVRRRRVVVEGAVAVPIRLPVGHRPLYLFGISLEISHLRAPIRGLDRRILSGLAAPNIDVCVLPVTQTEV